MCVPKLPTTGLVEGHEAPFPAALRKPALCVPLGSCASTHWERTAVHGDTHCRLHGAEKDTRWPRQERCCPCSSSTARAINQQPQCCSTLSHDSTTGEMLLIAQHNKQLHLVIVFSSARVQLCLTAVVVFPLKLWWEVRARWSTVTTWVVKIHLFSSSIHIAVFIHPTITYQACPCRFMCMGLCKAASSEKEWTSHIEGGWCYNLLDCEYEFSCNRLLDAAVCVHARRLGLDSCST